MSYPNRITSDQFYKALKAAGIVTDEESIRRIVIDAEAGHVVMFYVERFGDERLLQVTPALTGIEISGVPS